MAIKWTQTEELPNSLKLRATVGNATLAAGQEFVLDLGTVVSVEISGKAPGDVDSSLQLLKDTHGDPFGKIIREGDKKAICFWRKPLVAWRTDYEANLPASDIASVHKKHGLSASEVIVLSGALLALQHQGKDAYIVCQIADIPAERQNAILDAAFEIRRLATNQSE